MKKNNPPDGKASIKRKPVYDLLYHDSRRVASLLAQFNPSDLLTGIKKSENFSRQNTDEGATNISTNVLVARAAGTLTLKHNITDGSSTETTFDPLWMNAINLLDFLNENKLIRTNLFGSAIGQFVIETGPLMISDLNRMKDIWQHPYIKEVLMKGILNEPIMQVLSEEQRQIAIREAELVFEMVPSMPHSLQARLMGKTGRIWCSLSDDALVGSAADIVLKHGSFVPGEWNLLAIFDAYPYDPNDATTDGRLLVDVLADLAGVGGGQIAVRLGQATRAFLGRPPPFFGVTPILIFREIAQGIN